MKITEEQIYGFRSAVLLTALHYWLARTVLDLVPARLATGNPSIIDGNQSHPVNRFQQSQEQLL